MSKRTFLRKLSQAKSKPETDLKEFSSRNETGGADVVHEAGNDVYWRRRGFEE